VRYLSRLTRAGLEAYVEYPDPSFPRLRRMVHETIKMGADNPDNYYMNAQVSGEYEYKIIGKRNSIDYISFHTQNGSYGSTGGLAPCGKLDDDELAVNDDGAFEIFVTHKKQGGNWLKIEKETTLLMVRQTFSDRSKEVPADMEIVSLSGIERPGPLTSKQMDEGLKAASMLVGGASLLLTRWAKDFQKHVNQLPLFDPDKSNAAGGDDTIIYYHSYWKLEPDEALLIEVTPPECDAWNFQLNNHWMESLDYRYHNICINKNSAFYEAGGKVRIVIAHENPGLPNWIETADHRQGTMCWRWYRIHPGSEARQASCSVVKISALK